MIFAAALGFVALMLVIKVLLKVNALGDEIAGLGGQVGKLETQLTALQLRVRQVDKADHQPPPRPPQPLRPAASTAPPVTAPPAPERTAPTPQQQDLEGEIGSRWILVVGIVVLVLGVGFF